MICHKIEIRTWNCQIIKKASADLKKKYFMQYFKSLDETLKDVPWSHVLNRDEKNFSDYPGSEKLIF